MMKQNPIEAVQPAYWFGDFVRFMLRPEKKGVVTSLQLFPVNSIIYIVTWEDGTENRHYAVELMPGDD